MKQFWECLILKGLSNISLLFILIFPFSFMVFHCPRLHKIKIFIIICYVSLHLILLFTICRVVKEPNLGEWIQRAELCDKLQDQVGSFNLILGRKPPLFCFHFSEFCHLNTRLELPWLENTQDFQILTSLFWRWTCLIVLCFLSHFLTLKLLFPCLSKLSSSGFNPLKDMLKLPSFIYMQVYEHKHTVSHFSN